MGQQQILLIVLSVILVGIAIAVGIAMFRGYSISSHQDAIVLDMMNIGSMAYQHKIRPSMMGGGAGNYSNFELPQHFERNANASYQIQIGDQNDTIAIIGTSSIYTSATITVTYDLQLNVVGDAFIKEGW